MTKVVNMLARRLKPVPDAVPTLVDIDPTIAELRAQLATNGARYGELQRELDALRPQLGRMASPTASPTPQLVAGLGNFSVLAGPEARPAGPDPHERAREIDAEMRGLAAAGELLQQELRTRSARASIDLCAARRGEYEATANQILAATAELWRALAAHEELIDGFTVDGASPAALDVVPTHRAREAVDSLIRQCRQRGMRLPADLPGFRA